MRIHDMDFEPYISAETIEKAVNNIAQSINTSYANREHPVILLVTLSGAMIFASDLCKKLTIPIELAFVKCSSYGQKTNSSGNVVFQIPPTIQVEHRDVIVIEDIVDTGNTWVALHAYLSARSVRSLKIATLLLKEAVYDKPLPLDYVALRVENKFLIGYGLDYNQLGRNFDMIYKPVSL